MGKEGAPEKVVQESRRKTRRRFSVEEKIRTVREGLRGEESVTTLCRKRAWRRICTTAGARSFSKPGRNGSSGTQRARRRPPKSPICGRQTWD